MSRAVFVGNGTQTNYTFSFPYISPSHIRVVVNDVVQLNPLQYTLNGSEIQFVTAPPSGAAILIRRETSPNNILVDFTDGSVLRSEDLDTAYLHNFYLAQEASDGYDALINNAMIAIANGSGVTVSDPNEVINALVNELISSSAALELQQRINDIDFNAESIITNANSIVNLGVDLQTQINQLGGGGGAVAGLYIQDNEPVPGLGGVPDPIVEGASWYAPSNNNAHSVYFEGAWVSATDARLGSVVSDLSTLAATVGSNSSAIANEEIVRANADTALAQTLGLLGVQNVDSTAFILDTSQVRLDTNGGDTLALRLTQLSATDTDNANAAAAASAAVSTESSARIAGDAALATDLTALESTVDDNAAQILTESNTRASEDAALAAQISTVSATATSAASDASSAAAGVTTLTADLAAEQTARADADAAISSSVSTLSATVSTNTADIATNAAGISSEATARANADSALSSTLTALSSTVGDNTAGILAEQIARASGDSALSSTLTGLTSTVNGNSATVASQATSINGLLARHSVSLNVNGYVTGFIQNNNGQSGDFVVLADRFAIVDPSGDAGETQFTPFSVSGGVVSMQDVIISGDLFVGGSISNSDMGDDSIGALELIAGVIAQRRTVSLSTPVATTSFVQIASFAPAFQMTAKHRLVFDSSDLSPNFSQTGSPVTYELRLLRNGSVVWTREFQHSFFNFTPTDGQEEFIDNSEPTGEFTYTLQYRKTGTFGGFASLVGDVKLDKEFL